jgi:hypothetical protein
MGGGDGVEPKENTMAQKLTSPVYSTLIVAGQEREDGWLPVGTAVDGNSIRAARKTIRTADLNAGSDPRVTLVCKNDGGQSAERAPLSAWRAGGVVL